MPKITTGTFHIFTFKDGLLARLAHDLRLRVDRWEVEVEGEAVTARCWTSSLWPEGAMSGGRLDAGALSDGDREKIRGNLTEKILSADRYPEITFTGAAPEGARTIRGELTLVGRSQPVEIPLRREGGQLTGELTLAPSRWGIEPYKAMGGAIKLQDKVRVTFTLDWP
jgi:hypothetical protein